MCDDVTAHSIRAGGLCAVRETLSRDFMLRGKPCLPFDKAMNHLLDENHTDYCMCTLGGLVADLIEPVKCTVSKASRR